MLSVLSLCPYLHYFPWSAADTAADAARLCAHAATSVSLRPRHHYLEDPRAVAMRLSRRPTSPVFFLCSLSVPLITRPYMSFFFLFFSV